MSRAGENLGICRKKVNAGVLWLKFSPGATESPHSFQGWGLFSHLARLPASPVLWNGSLQGTAQEQADGGHHASTSLLYVHGRTVWTHFTWSEPAWTARVFTNSLTQASEVQRFFYAAPSKKSSQDSWLVTKKFWESMLKKVNTVCQ